MLGGLIIVVTPGARRASAPIVTAPLSNAAVVQQFSSASSLSIINLMVKSSFTSVNNWALIAYLSLSLISVPRARFFVYPSLLCLEAEILKDVLSDIGPVTVPANLLKLYSPVVNWSFPPKSFSGRAVVMLITPAIAFYQIELTGDL